jgi:hypothetical protein
MGTRNQNDIAESGGGCWHSHSRVLLEVVLPIVNPSMLELKDFPCLI